MDIGLLYRVREAPLSSRTNNGSIDCLHDGIVGLMAIAIMFRLNKANGALPPGARGATLVLDSVVDDVVVEVVVVVGAEMTQPTICG